ELIPENKLIEHYADVGLNSHILREARKAKKLKYVPIGRNICYRVKAVADWFEILENEEEECRANTKTKSLRSPVGGLIAFPEAPSGTPSTTTPSTDESAAKALAASISKKPRLH
ncbi:MAG: hypothetical protein KGJ81_04780, partial [Alphaproteobacteria bacterium]|nr:hypothetical protein [Alphaproteobacteria bacterium]